MACNLLHKIPEFYVKDGKIYNTRTNKEKENSMDNKLILEIIKRLEDRKDKQMNSYFKQFYTETIKMLNEDFIDTTYNDIRRDNI